MDSLIFILIILGLWHIVISRRTRKLKPEMLTEQADFAMKSIRAVAKRRAQRASGGVPTALAADLTPIMGIPVIQPPRQFARPSTGEYVLHVRKRK